MVVEKMRSMFFLLKNLFFNSFGPKTLIKKPKDLEKPINDLKKTTQKLEIKNLFELRFGFLDNFKVKKHLNGTLLTK